MADKRQSPDRYLQHHRHGDRVSAECCCGMRIFIVRALQLQYIAGLHRVSAEQRGRRRRRRRRRGTVKR